jgi:UDP-N-acetylmuramate: L-alanyl-gamma-D-glutamyl-meso-diaminopimelate ligase
MSRKVQEEESVRRIAEMSQLATGSHIHIIGISGAGTAQLAVLLKELGYRVSGSDKAFYPPAGPLVQRTVDRVFSGFSSENLNPRPDWVIVGNSVGPSNEEAVGAEQLGIPFSSMPEALAAFLIGDHNYCGTSIVAAGTHGKTTTSAALAEMLDSCGLAPGFFVGGVPHSFESGLRQVDLSRPAKERVVVLEGDEYDSAFFAKWPKFHSYRPDILIITSLDFDHGDIYASIEEIETEFSLLVQRVPESGTILINDSHDRLQKLAKLWRENSNVKARILFYGEASDSTYKVIGRQVSSGKQELELSLAGTGIQTKVQLIGRHNAHNLTAVAAVGSILGIEPSRLASGLASVKGVQRRQTVLVDNGDILLIEDFAHHPVEVAATLRAVKEAYPTNRLVAVFEPRSNTSRRDFFQHDYAESLAVADVVLIKTVDDASGYSKTADPIVGLDVPKIIDELHDRGVFASCYSSSNDVFSGVLEQKRNGDVVVVMSNGSFDGLAQKLQAKLG